jgi:hypothetical protein
MRKTLIEGVLDTIIMTVLGFATLWLFRVDGELLVMAMAFGTYGIIGALVFDDWLYKRLKFPKLLNWQDRTGAVMAFVADEAALVAVYSETMPLFRMCSAVSVSFGAGAFVWFWKVYTPSVMKLEQRDLYDRKNYEGSVRRAKTKGKLATVKSLQEEVGRFHFGFGGGVTYVPPDGLGVSVDLALRKRDFLVVAGVEYYPAKAVMERDPDKLRYHMSVLYEF